jgi:nucleotide-binding universal stress UspA family protein
MINPLRSEAEAFRFVLGSVVYFGAIGLATVVNGWLGLAVFVALTIALLAWWARARRQEPPVQVASERRWGEDERHILVIANETVGGERLRDELRKRSEGYREQVLVVCPALNSPLRHWASDEDPARAAAQERLESSLRRLRELGIEARGEVGDGDPLQALEDAMRTFGADEIIISTHPPGRSHWLEKGVVERARERFAVPIMHVVTDLAAERDEVR